MRNPVFILIFGLILLVYSLINYYIGLRGWQTVLSHTGLNSRLYWLVFWLLALSYLIGRIGEKLMPGGLSRGFVYVGSYWLGVMFYFFLIWAFVDIMRIIINLTRIFPEGIKYNGQGMLIVGTVVLFTAAGLLIYGTWNARNPRINHYDVTINKKAGNLNQLHIVMVSDIHLGTIIKNGRLLKMVDMVNKLNPDIVLFAGDVIDEDVEFFIEQKMSDYFRKIKSRYGVFAVLGNHEYIGGHAEEAVKGLSEAGITVLRDRAVKVADGIYIVGRDDRSAGRLNHTPRLALKEIMKNVDKSFPVIVLDHQPTNLAEAESQGVDLQFSGHTHRGQMFPNQLITQRMFEDDWGYLKKGPLQVIVSSGYGTWGPPIRIGNKPEIVDVELHFAK